MRIGVVSETFAGERRVALVPGSIAALKKAGLDVSIEQGAGARSGFTDAMYAEKGAEVVPSRNTVLSSADVLVQVRVMQASGGGGDLALLKPGQIVIGMADPLGSPQTARDLA